MPKKIANEVTQTIKASIGKKLSSATLNRLARKAALTQVNECRRRVLAKQDREGRPIKAPSKKWKERKDAILSGRSKSRGFRRTGYAAKSSADRGRFSGRTLTDLTFTGARGEQTRDGVKVSWHMAVRNPRSADVIDGLKRRGYDIYGPARGGKALQQEQKAIRSEITATLKANS